MRLGFLLLAILDWATFAVLVPSELPHLNDLLHSIPSLQVKYSIVSIGVSYVVCQVIFVRASHPNTTATQQSWTKRRSR